jgi:FAD/FMN-containing dehydrogenase
VSTHTIAADLRAVVGADALLTDTAAIEPMLVDHRALYHGRAAAVVRPRDVASVTRLLAYCNARRIGVVPQGGNTSYCGGATPDETGTQVLLSLSRLNAVRALDAANYSITAEAGCILANVQAAALAAERLFPLSLGSEGSCELGGNLSTNAGGLNVVRYGMTRDLALGLEVVLADGRMLSSLHGLRKDNTGYDIKNLFIGAEGTLGVITAATLKLFPLPRSHATAFLAVANPASAVALLSRMRAGSGETVSSFELIPRIAVELTTKHIPDVVDPLATPAEWYVLCELSSSDAADSLTPTLEGLLAPAIEAGEVLDGALAQNERQRQAFWRLRESIPAAQKLDGASLKHDVSLPVSEIPQFVATASAWLQAHMPEGVLVSYGHLGDGNLHFNLNQRPGTDRAAFLRREPEIKRYVHDLVRDSGGSFSAEHGIGRLKVGELARYADPVELSLMHAIKQAFDPNGIMNPGKVLAR